MDIKFKSEIKDGYLIKSAYFDGEHHYFKIPQIYKDEITGLDDPMAILLVFSMMRRGGDMRIRGKISKSLLNNLELFTSYWTVLKPEYYKPVNIFADEEINDVPVRLNNKAVACFSGGLDSAFMLYRHKNNLAGRNNRNIERAVFVWGTDILLNEPKRFEQALASCNAMCKDIGVELVAVENNYRNYPHIWEMEHIQIMAAALRLWKNYPYQMIGSSGWAASFMYPWGSNPVTDHLLSGNNYKVISDDIDFTRTEKAAFVKDWPAALKHLRVCWQNPSGGGNCGICEKCLRTYLNFMVFGVTKLECMPEPFSWEKFRNVYFDDKENYYAEIISHIDNNPVNNDRALEIKKRWKQALKFKKIRMLDKKIDYYRCLALSRIKNGERQQHYKKKADKHRQPVKFLPKSK